jgi:predicted  nucleic acid-binding Zn-ribbon protein
MDEFNALAEFKKQRERTKLIRKASYRKSKLDDFSGELVELRNLGSSLSELQQTLKEKNVNADTSTISRWLKNRIPDNG